MSSVSKSPKRRAKLTKSAPTVSDLIVRAVSGSQERIQGMSLVALKRTLQAGGYDVVKNKSRILNGLRRLVATKSLVQTKGTGASGSFKVSKIPPPSPRKAKKVAQKGANAPRRKKAPAKKPPVARATLGVIKSPAKRRRTSSVKKAKNPAGVKKGRSPGKPTRRLTRSRAAAKK